MGHRNGVHKYETHFQAGGSIYGGARESTRIPSQFSEMRNRPWCNANTRKKRKRHVLAAIIGSSCRNARLSHFLTGR